MSQVSENLIQRYARSFLEILGEMGGDALCDRAQQELISLSQSAEGPAQAFFSNPVFSETEKGAVLTSLLEKKKMAREVQRFTDVLLQLGHFSLLPEITRVFEEANRERRNEILVHIRSAFPLTAEEEKQLSRALHRLTQKKVLLDPKVDSTLIGGAVAEVDGVIYDASIQSFLTRLQREMRA